jgi:hypothetical protein
MTFGGGVIVKATSMVFPEIEEVSCEVTGCNSCTDIEVDGHFDINARSSFVRSTALIRYATKNELTDDHYATLTPRMYGYALQERRWHACNVENIRDHETDSNKLQHSIKSFDDLVLPSAHKALLRALVSNQTRQFRPASTTPSVDSPKTTGKSTEISMELVRGKGKGVIILLHGVPGVGKTSTAEYVAFHLGRPLFPIICGGLGIDADTVELRLEEYFRLASQWGCVLLLDEADVFLAKRAEDQLKRNALVSGKKTRNNRAISNTNAMDSLSKSPRMLLPCSDANHQPCWLVRRSVPLAYPHQPLLPETGQRTNFRDLENEPQVN